AGGQPPLPARRRRHHRHDRLPRRPAQPRHPAHHHHREDAMTTKTILPPPASTYQLLLDAADTWPDGIATDRYSGEVPVAYGVPAGPGRFDEADLLAWAADAIDEAAARPKRIYPMTAIPVTE